MKHSEFVEVPFRALMPGDEFFHLGDLYHKTGAEQAAILDVYKDPCGHVVMESHYGAWVPATFAEEHGLTSVVRNGAGMKDSTPNEDKTPGPVKDPTWIEVSVLDDDRRDHYGSLIPQQAAFDVRKVTGLLDGYHTVILFDPRMVARDYRIEVEEPYLEALRRIMDARAAIHHFGD